MGFSESSIFAKVAFVLSIVGALVLVIGLATDFWKTAEVSGIKYNTGLFSSCASSNGHSSCVSFEGISVESWLEAVRAFEIIAFLVAIGLVVVLIVWIFVKSDMKVLHLVALILSFVAAGCVFLGIIIYGAETTDGTSRSNFDWSFGLTIVSGIIFIITGVLLVVDKVMT